MCPPFAADIKEHIIRVAARKWTPIIKVKKGLVFLGGETRAYRVSVREGDPHTPIDWRRFAGKKLIAHGTFVGSTDVVIHPSDRNLDFEVYAPERVVLAAVRVAAQREVAPKPRRKKSRK